MQLRWVGIAFLAAPIIALLIAAGSGSAASCTDNVITGTDMVGFPPSTSAWFDPFTTDTLTYDAGYNVFRRQSHGKTLTVAIRKTFLLSGTSHAQVAEFLLDTWAVYRHEFGGFSFKDYTIVIGGPQPFENSFGNGFDGDDTNVYDNFYTHEIYHAWAGSSFSGLDGRMWLTEGTAVYYGLRQQRENSHQWLMAQYLNLYEDAVNSGRDVAIADMKLGQPGYDHSFVPVKAAIVLFKLDQELLGYGVHLGHVLRELYQRYGATSHGKVTNNQILQVVNDVTGADFTNFFNKYIFGKDKVSVANLQRICHEMDPLRRTGVTSFVPLLLNK